MICVSALLMTGCGTVHNQVNESLRMNRMAAEMQKQRSQAAAVASEGERSDDSIIRIQVYMKGEWVTIKQFQGLTSSP
jgi:hypothetical protein